MMWKAWGNQTPNILTLHLSNKWKVNSIAFMEFCRNMRQNTKI